jgi:hypothetical protein
MPKFIKNGIEWVTADEDLEQLTPRYAKVRAKGLGKSLTAKKATSAVRPKKAAAR